MHCEADGTNCEGSWDERQEFRDSFTKLESAWLMLGATLLGLAAKFFA
jgi:hypothetical protein